MAVIIIGSRGMLGSMMAKVMPDAQTLNRPELDVKTAEFYITGDTYINCVGLIKPYCDNVKQAIDVNARFPYKLPAGTIQIATDCVYFGSKGNYVESDPHDAIDVYGKTKSLGEASHLINLRCSIIGPEIQNHVSLFDWFLRQKGSVDGFTNHRWNGVTTYHFAKIAKAIVDNNLYFKEELPALQHIVPADSVTKAELLKIIKEEFKHKIRIIPKTAPQAIDRTLATNHPELNKRLWKLAGYDEPPTIRQMIRELAALK
jgi:dTDP-4-dehydrorhamnose reductase